MYVSCVLGDKLRITMSSIMRWRRREIGLVIDGLLSTGLHERAILADRRLPTDDQNPIEMTDGPTGDYSKSDKALSKPSKSTFSIWVSDLDPGDYRGSGLVQRALRNIQPGCRLVRLDAHELDHLGPLLGF